MEDPKVAEVRIGENGPVSFPWGCQMEESQCVLKYSCALSCRPFLMCTSVPMGPGLCMSIHFISNYSLSLGQTLIEITPARAELQHLYLEKLHHESSQQV